MILAHIIAKNKEQALIIVDLLMKKKLLTQAAVSEKTIYLKKSGNNKLKDKKQILIIGITKALLFKSINEELKSHFPKDMPILYSVPIVYIDEDQASELRENTAKV